MAKAMLRTLAASIILIGIFAVSRLASANEVSMHKYAAEELKTVCEKVGGKFSQDAGGYGCGTNCNGGPGTDCVVSCKTDQPCFAQVIGSRRPTSPLSALQAPNHRAR